MDSTALRTLTTRLRGMGYCGNEQQLISLIVLAEQETEEVLYLAFWEKYPMLRRFVDHAHKHHMYFIAADPTGLATAQYVRKNEDDNALRLTQFEIRDIGCDDRVLVKAFFTRQGEMVKVRNLMCRAK